MPPEHTDREFLQAIINNQKKLGEVLETIAHDILNSNLSIKRMIQEEIINKKDYK